VAAAAAATAWAKSRESHPEQLAALREEQGQGIYDLDAVPAAAGVGLLLPPWVATTEDGQTIDSTTLAGEPYLVSLWASWCLPCLKELPELSEEVLAAEGDMRVLAISVDDREGAWRRRLRQSDWDGLKHGWNPTLLGVFGIDGLPTSFIVDSQGRVVHIERGYADGGAADLVQRLQKEQGE
jgi:thiol-disulfide isomerase/thioredoxin